MDDSYYDLAQICENGHVANSCARDYPARNQVHCDKCGSRTILEEIGASVRRSRSGSILFRRVSRRGVRVRRFRALTNAA